MLRFLPDDWLEGLLRPFVMIDPRAGIYFEETAPDWRFAIFIAFMTVALATRRGRRTIDYEQGQLSLALLVLLYVWTFTIGNGRYFMTGLLLVGPLLVAAWRRLPGTSIFRWVLLFGAMSLQAAVIESDYARNKWGLTRWIQGPGIDIEDEPIRHQPATFITSTAISYSILVPRFHPASRWANVVGQVDIKPSMREYPRLLELLSSPLPMYLVVPISSAHVRPGRNYRTDHVDTRRVGCRHSAVHGADAVPAAHQRQA